MDIGLSIVRHWPDTDVMPGMEEFGALIKSARVAKGMTGPELATRLGRAHSFVVRLEKGTNSNPPDVAVFDQLEEVLGLSRNLMLRRLGYLREDESEAQPKAAERALLPIIRGHEWTEPQLRAAAGALRAIAEMGKG